MNLYNYVYIGFQVYSSSFSSFNNDNVPTKSISKEINQDANCYMWEYFYAPAR